MSELREHAEGGDADGAPTTPTERPSEVLAVADRLREDGHHHGAIERYRWLLDRAGSPDGTGGADLTGQDLAAAAHFGIGQCHGKLYDFGTAVRHLDRAFGLNPARSHGASYYAYVLERLGRMDDADRWYEHALAGDDADDLWARSHYAWFLQKWGRTDRAVAVYQDVLRRNPLYTWAGKRYALLLRRLGEPERAADMLRETVARAPGNRFAALNYLEYLLLTEREEYTAVRATLDAGDAPAWYPVVLEMYDYYREHLLPSRPDPARLAAWWAAADALTESVHRDFEDLTALLAERGGDVRTWRVQVQRLLK